MIVEFTSVDGVGNENPLLIDSDKDPIVAVYKDPGSVNEWTTIELQTGQVFWVTESVEEVKAKLDKGA